MSDTWKFIFVRSPKTSSAPIVSAIKSLLCGGRCTEVQFTQVRRMDQLAPKWESYFVFTIVRNPWLRALSAYSAFTSRLLRRYAVPSSCHHTSQSQNFH